ncbi:MAG: 3'-5' exonuclease [Anaerolineales bacterium]|nr:3'-5' exonuclease [Anaerolineales bacterium]
MNHSQLGILDQSIHETPIAVIDFETTGLTPGFDRVIEVSVVRLDPGGGSRVVLDTLVNPRRIVAATEIHGITDSDVAGAPTFNDIAGDLVRALSDCPVAAYNVYFDIKFLASELQQAGMDAVPPHFCLMYLRPMLGLGRRCTLENACQEHGIEYAPVHAATHDALAAAKLMEIYLGEMKARGIGTFGELAKLKSYKFIDSFDLSPLPASLATAFANCTRLKSRSGYTVQSAEPLAATPTEVSRPRRSPAGAYWDALKTVLSDLRVTDEEIVDLQRTKQSLGLSDEQTRAIHAKAFIGFFRNSHPTTAWMRRNAGSSTACTVA